MPLDYLAFCQTHRTPYTHYALVRVGDGHGAASVVEATFAALAVIWPHILGSERPDALAWEILTRVASPGTGTTRHQDATLLCRRLGMPAKEAASLMGIEEPLLHLVLGTPLHRSGDRGSQSH